MHKTGADFTNSFRCLSQMELPRTDDQIPDFTPDILRVKEILLSQCASVEELKADYAPQMDPRFKQMRYLMLIIHYIS